jgi:lipopolysaccharide biosynthesis glycosyltransferase
VVVFLLTRNEKDYEPDFCYNDALYSLFPIPFYAKYNDYGGAEDCHGPALNFVMNRIKQSHLYNETKIIFETNDNYDSLDAACKARLDIFSLTSISDCNKILYLDTDILIKDDINKVFDVCKDDVLYTLEEGSIIDQSDYWGKRIFGEEANNYADKTAFTSGVLLFNNCNTMKGLFEKINKDISESKSVKIGDQPFNKAICLALEEVLSELNFQFRCEKYHPHLRIKPDITVETSNKIICLEFCYTLDDTPGNLADYVLRKLNTYMKQLEQVYGRPQDLFG